MGYHLKPIEKGVLGEFSKIREEFQEAEDADLQGDSLLMFCELADMLGAMEEYLKKWNLTIEDLKKFSNKTKSAFKEGKR